MLIGNCDLFQEPRNPGPPDRADSKVAPMQMLTALHLAAALLAAPSSGPQCTTLIWLCLKMGEKCIPQFVEILNEEDEV